ncbi:hypothetical protein, partial [Pseudomonas gingeri]|uniref:hypothetical protein n=1 Tax=Pseudomonas gingeri TaxID=117681 RepID=UPI001C433139
MTVSDTLILPPPFFADDNYSCNPDSTPPCQEPRVDAVHITGDDTSFYVLSDPEQRRLIKAIEVVEALMKEFQKIIQSPPQEAQSCKAGGCWPAEDNVRVRGLPETGLGPQGRAGWPAQPAPGAGTGRGSRPDGGRGYPGSYQRTQRAQA